MPTHGRWWLETTLLALLAGSGALNVLLSWRVLSNEKARQPRDTITGRRLPELVGRDVEGRPLTIRYTDSHEPTVLLVLHPLCRWCQENMSLWRRLSTASRGYRFVAASTA